MHKPGIFLVKVAQSSYKRDDGNDDDGRNDDDDDDESGAPHLQFYKCISFSETL